MKLRILLAALLALLLAASLCSCGFIVLNDMSGQETEESAEETETEKHVPEITKFTKYRTREDSKAISDAYLNELPGRDYEGAVFFLTTADSHYIAPDETESVVSRLAIQRNAEIEDRYNITILIEVESPDEIREKLAQNIAADSFYSDLIMIPLYRTGEFQYGDLLLNMRTAPFFDITQPYFNSESSDMTSGGYRTYGIAGDATIEPTRFAALYFNRASLTGAGVDVEALYNRTAAGQWTWDELLEIRSAVETVGSAGVTFSAADELAARLPDLVFKSMGNLFVTSEARKVPMVGFTLRNGQSVLNVLSQLYNNPTVQVRSEQDTAQLFASGETAFRVDYLETMPTLTNAAVDWGVLPLPKAVAAQESYKTLADNNTLIFSIPKNHTNPEIPVIILSALNAASSGYFGDAYVEYNMMNVVRDNGTINMIDLILKTASFDFALAFGNAYPEIADATFRLIRDCAATNDLSAYYSERRAEANRVMRENFDLTY
ncbi:MAG: extracellular solute-binding protein [Clostridia bacterium]|nr:extracellular solute-binding protein [Clostridia bacterium]